jgi:hypothetical protein
MSLLHPSTLSSGQADDDGSSRPFGLTRQTPLPVFEAMPDLVYNPAAQLNHVGALDGPPLVDDPALMPQITITWRTGPYKNDNFSDDTK